MAGSARVGEPVLYKDECLLGACESRQEWLIMYCRAVPAPVVASWCRVSLGRAVRAVDRQIARDPAWFNACWLVHD